RWQLMDAISSGGQAQLTVETADGLQRERTLQFVPAAIEPDGVDLMAEAGLSLATPKPKVTGVNPGEPGEQAGLQEGDVIIKVGELEQPSAGAMVEEVKKHPDQSLPITVLRDGAALTLTVLPLAQTGQD